VVRRLLLDRGVPLRPPCPASGPYKEVICERHAGGKSVGEISQELGLDFATVYRVLRQAGRVHKKRP
jgi:DNA-directed RNA polymerase specialized sigma24 family protein